MDARSRRAKFEESGDDRTDGVRDTDPPSSDGGIETDSDFLYIMKKRFFQWWTEPEYIAVKTRTSYTNKDQLVLV